MPEAYRFEALVEAIAALSRRLDMAQPVVAGVGIGGTIAAAVAQIVEAAAVVCVANKPGKDPPDREGARERTAREVVENGSAALAPALAAAALAEGAATELHREVTSMIAEADPRAIAALGRLIARRPDIVKILAGVQAPILVVGGSADRLSPAAAVEALADALPGATLRIVPGAGHWSPEAPDAMNELLDLAIRLSAAD